MATRIPTGHRVMRKSPKQQRSQVTVEIIVEAGARVLAHKGWANFTTNEVVSCRTPRINLIGVILIARYEWALLP